MCPVKLPTPALALLLLAGQPAWADEELSPAPEPETEPTGPDDRAYETHRQRGIHYYRNGVVEAARRELEAALASKGGQEDFLTHLYIARLQHETGEIEAAHLSATRAQETAKGESQIRQAKEFQDGLKGFYGEAVFNSAGPDAGPKSGYLLLQADSPFIRPEKKRAYRAVRKLYRETEVRLPRTLYLPGGSYSANGVGFKVKAGELTHVSLGLVDAPGSGGFPWLWAGIGTGVAVAAGVAAWLLWPEPEPERSVRFEGSLFGTEP